MAKVKIHTDELYEDTSTHDVYRRLLDGTYELVKVSGAALVNNDGSVGQSHNRYLSAVPITTWVAATSSVTWTAANAVKEVTIVAPSTASLTRVLCLFGLASDGDVLAAIADAIVTSNSSDLAPYWVLPGTSKTFKFTTGITRADFLAIGAATALYVEAN